MTTTALSVGGAILCFGVGEFNVATVQELIRVMIESLAAFHSTFAQYSQIPAR